MQVKERRVPEGRQWRTKKKVMWGGGVGTIVGLFFGLVYVLSHRLARLSEASTSDCACVEKMVMRGERRDVAAARRLVDCGRCSRCHGLLEDPFCSLNEFDAQRQDGLEADLR